MAAWSATIWRACRRLNLPSSLMLMGMPAGVCILKAAWSDSRRSATAWRNNCKALLSTLSTSATTCTVWLSGLGGALGVGILPDGTGGRGGRGAEPFLMVMRAGVREFLRQVKKALWREPAFDKVN